MTSAQLKTFVSGFESTLETGQDASRKLLMTFVDVGTSSAPSWEYLGAGVEESSIEFNIDSETKTDIQGVTRTRVNKSELKQSFDPNTINKNSTLTSMLDSIMVRNALDELPTFKVMIVRGYLKNDSGYLAEVHKNCTVLPQSLGGSGYVDFPYEIQFSNDKTYGTVAELTSTPTFTEYTPS